MKSLDDAILFIVRWYLTVAVTLFGLLIVTIIVSAVWGADCGTAFRPEKAGYDLQVLRRATLTFRSRQGRLPTVTEWPRVLLEAPPNGAPLIDCDDASLTDGAHGGILDPWDRPYIYRPGANGTFELICHGADGEDGGSGDDRDIVVRQP